jgi:hypothetical protein
MYCRAASSKCRSGGTSYSTLGKDVEVEQETVARLGAPRRELLQKRVRLEHLPEWIEVLFPAAAAQARSPKDRTAAVDAGSALSSAAMRFGRAQRWENVTLRAFQTARYEP